MGGFTLPYWHRRPVVVAPVPRAAHHAPLIAAARDIAWPSNPRPAPERGARLLSDRTRLSLPAVPGAPSQASQRRAVDRSVRRSRIPLHDTRGVGETGSGPERDPGVQQPAGRPAGDRSFLVHRGARARGLEA